MLYHPNAVVVKTLRAAQVVSVAVVLFVAFTMWGIQKMLFKIAEREQLRNHNAEQAAHIAELENQKAQQNDEEHR